MLVLIKNIYLVNYIKDTIGDAHIYRNHFDVVKEQISRKPLPMCKLVLNPEVKSIFDYKIEDIKIEGYQSYGRLVGKVSV